MNHEAMAERFGVRLTKRQIRKWGRGVGILRRLMEHFGTEGDPPSKDLIREYLNRMSQANMRKGITNGA